MCASVLKYHKSCSKFIKSCVHFTLIFCSIQVKIWSFDQHKNKWVKNDSLCFGVDDAYHTIFLLFLNSWRAKFFRDKVNIYLHFMSLLHIYMTQVLKILPQVRPVPTYSTQSISWLLMSWGRKEPGLQQPWYWPSSTEITLSPHVKG